MIDLELMRTAILTAVADEPFGGGFIYRTPGESSCVYTHEGKPSCLIGRALHLLGVEVPIDFNGESARTLLGRTSLIGETVTATAIAYAAEVQRSQDGLMAWGVAVNGAEYDYSFEIAQL